MNVFVGLVLLAAFIGAYASGFYTGMRLTRPLKSQYVLSKARSSQRFRLLDSVGVWWMRVFVAATCGQVFSLPLWVLAVLSDHMR